MGVLTIRSRQDYNTFHYTLLKLSDHFFFTTFVQVQSCSVLLFIESTDWTVFKQVFRNQTLWIPDNWRPFEIRTRPVFGLLLYVNDKLFKRPYRYFGVSVDVPKNLQIGPTKMWIFGLYWILKKHFCIGLVLLFA